MNLIINITGILASTFAIYKAILEILDYKINKTSNTYKLTKEFIYDYKNKSTHQLIIENGFAAILKKRLNYDEIMFLLSKDNPNRAISDRFSAGKFIKFEKINSAYIWNENYIDINKTKYKEFKHKLLYFICSSFGIYPLLILNKIQINKIYAIAFTISMLFIAVINIIELDKFRIAKIFMERITNQNY